jgi:hypothetical protein
MGVLRVGEIQGKAEAGDEMVSEGRNDWDKRTSRHASS